MNPKIQNLGMELTLFLLQYFFNLNRKVFSYHPVDVSGFSLKDLLNGFIIVLPKIKSDIALSCSLEFLSGIQYIKIIGKLVQLFHIVANRLGYHLAIPIFIIHSLIGTDLPFEHIYGGSNIRQSIMSPLHFFPTIKTMGCGQSPWLHFVKNPLHIHHPPIFYGKAMSGPVKFLHEHGT